MTKQQIDEMKVALAAVLQETDFPVCKIHAARMDRIEAALLHVTELMTGNGDAAKGLIVRTDRLEQRIFAIDRVAWSLTAVGIMLLATSIWNIIAP